MIQCTKSSVINRTHLVIRISVSGLGQIQLIIYERAGLKHGQLDSFSVYQSRIQQLFTNHV
jgi:hypothetical protein